MNPALVIALSLAVVAAAFFVPKFVGQKFGPGTGLAAGLVGIIVLLALALRIERLGMFDIMALAVLVQGAVSHYRKYDEAQMKARGEAAIAAAEANRS